MVSKYYVLVENDSKNGYVLTQYETAQEAVEALSKVPNLQIGRNYVIKGELLRPHLILK